MSGLNEIQTFLEEIAHEEEEDEHPDIKHSNLRLDENEITGEITNWAFQYLSHRKSPGILIPIIVKLIVSKVQQECRKSPEDCGYNVEKGYDPAILKQVFCRTIKNFCQNLSDNSEMTRIMSMCENSEPPPKCVSKEIKNSRRYMEDRHVYIPDICNVYNVKDYVNMHFYGVFDGHGGCNAANYTVAQLPILLASDPSFPKNPSDALQNSFLEADKNFIKKKVASGTTAVCALYTPHEQKLYVSWVGDSKALLVKNGQVMQIVRCHKPEIPEERSRITRLGGSVLRFSGAYRVDGVIGLSRAIGNISHKPHLTAEPDIVCLELDKNEDFLVIACDGLWDYVSEEEVALTVYTQLKSDYEKLDDITERLIKLSKSNGSADNITILIVFFKSPQLISTFSWPFKTMETVADKINGDGLISQEISQTNMNLGNPFFTESQHIDGEEKHDQNQTEPLTSDLKEFISGKFDDMETSKDFSEKCIIAEDNQNISPSPMGDDFGPETSVDIMDIKMECQKAFGTELPPNSFDIEPNFQPQEGEFNLTCNIANENVNLFGLEKNHDHDKTDFSLDHELPISPENNKNIFGLAQVLETNENKVDDALDSFTDTLKGNQILESLMKENPIEFVNEDTIQQILTSFPESGDILLTDQHENILGDIEAKIEKEHVDISEQLREEKPELELIEPGPVVEEIVTKIEVTANTTSVPESCDESEDEWSYMRLKEGKGEKQSLELDACAENSPAENLDKIDSDKSWQPKETLDKHLDEKPFLPKLDLNVDTEDMASSQLNPDAKEFVPLSSPNPSEEIPNGIFNAAMDLKQQDDLVAQSPRKGAFSMENIQIPSENEFELEIAHRPSEIKEVEFDEPYQELNLKEAMHEAEKEEPITSPDELFDNLEPETNVPQSLYVDPAFDGTDDLMNKVQMLPTELIDGEEISMNGHNDITAEFSEENVIIPQDADDLVKDLHVDEAYDNSNEFGFKVEDNLAFDDIATKTSEAVNLFKDSLDQDNEPIEKHFEEDTEKSSFVNEIVETHIKSDFMADLTSGLTSNIKKEMEEAKDHILNELIPQQQSIVEDCGIISTEMQESQDHVLNEFIPQQQSILDDIAILPEKLKTEQEQCTIPHEADSNKKEFNQLPKVEEKSFAFEEAMLTDLIIPATMAPITEQKKEPAITKPAKEESSTVVPKVQKVEKKLTDPKKIEVKSKLGVTNGIKKVPSSIDKVKSSQVTAAKPKAPLTRPRTAPVAPKTSIVGVDKKPLASAISTKTKTEMKPSTNTLTKKPITKVDPSKTTTAASRTNVTTKTTLTKPTAPATTVHKTARVPLTSTITKTSAQKPLLSPNPKSTILQNAAKNVSPRSTLSTTVRKTEAVKTTASVPLKTTRTTTTTTTITSKTTNAKSTVTAKVPPASAARKSASSTLTKPQLKKSPTKTGTAPVPVTIPVSNGTKALDNSIEQK